MVDLELFGHYKKKKTCVLLFLMSIFIFLRYQSHTFAQNTSRWGLPEGAIARFGKGTVVGIGYSAIDRGIVYSPDGTRLAVASTPGIWLYDTATYQPVALLSKHTDRVVSIAFSPDGSTLVSGSLGGTIRFWDAYTGTFWQTLTAHVDHVNSVAFSPDGKTLVTGGKRNGSGIRLWDTLTREYLKTLGRNVYRINHIRFSPDEKTVIATGHGSDSRSSIHLWNVLTAEHSRIPAEHTEDVHNVAFSPDGNTIASTSGNHIYLSDAHTGALRRTITGHTKRVESVAFSPDGNTVASTSWDNTIRLWDAGTGEPQHTITTEKLNRPARGHQKN